MKERNPEIFDLIESYLMDKLSSKDRQEFEQRMESDATLKAEVEKHFDLHKSISNADLIDFRKKVMLAEKNYNSSSKSISWWKIAASLVVLLGLGILFSILWDDKPAILFDDYYRPYPVEDVFRGEASNSLEQAVDLYTNEDYENAIPAFKKLKEKFPSNYQLTMYLGSCYLGINNPDKALNEFQQLTTIPAYQEHATWYLSLSYLSLGNKAKASSLLQKIVAYDGIYKSDAINLLEDLSKEKSTDDS